MVDAADFKNVTSTIPKDTLDAFQKKVLEDVEANNATAKTVKAVHITVSQDDINRVRRASPK